jgi:signal transduction histidine kinase
MGMPPDLSPAVADLAGPHLADDFLTRPAQQNHIVQFYEDDTFLAEVVGRFVGAGMGAGEPIVIIATGAHREMFEQRLEDKGFHVARTRITGQLTMLDASETLAQFMVGREPDPQLFASVVGGVLNKIASRSCHARIRAYGEMVDLLWKAGNPEGAIRLEELWNNLGKEHDFSLLCAYGMGNFEAAADGHPFHAVCKSHSHVIPTERYSQIVEPHDRLREVTQLQQRARALENEIEQRKKVEQALRDALRQRDEFLSIAGHELKTPLTAAQLMVDSMMPRVGEPALQDRLGKTSRSLSRLGRLIDELLDVSRISAGRLTLELESVDLSALARDVVESASQQLARAGCALTLYAEQPVVGTWDRLRLEQVIGNLVSNAIKYGAGAPIEIRVEARPDVALLVIRDHGIGISPADQQRIFDRFERAVSPQHFGGLGLGLFIVRQVLEAQGATIRVESQPGAGASFIVELPYRR